MYKIFVRNGTQNASKKLAETGKQSTLALGSLPLPTLLYARKAEKKGQQITLKFLYICYNFFYGIIQGKLG